ncbi:MAG: hypothetical protein H0U18_17050 [Pyrinomonadaceae bacterium]|nr:hypothetical protein [Pyrinomonadaceae bacterium]
MKQYFLVPLAALLVFLVTGAWMNGMIPDLFPNLRLKMLGNGFKIRNLRHKPRSFKQVMMLAMNVGFISTTYATVIRADGRVEDLGMISRRVVTNVGANAVASAFNGAFTLSDFDFHGSGTGITAEAVGDTALVTEVATRATGTASNPTAPTYRSVGTVTYAASFAITEHGLFSASTSGTLFDRSVFAAINVANGDSIQFTYTLTVSSGG